MICLLLWLLVSCFVLVGHAAFELKIGIVCLF